MFCAVHWILDTGMLCIFAQEKSTYKSQQQSSYLWISLAWKCKQCVGEYVREGQWQQANSAMVCH